MYCISNLNNLNSINYLAIFILFKEVIRRQLQLLSSVDGAVLASEGNYTLGVPSSGWHLWTAKGMWEAKPNKEDYVVLPLLAA